MLSFRFLQAVAAAVYDHFTKLRSEIRRLEGEPPHPLDATALGLPPKLSKLEFVVRYSQELARRLSWDTPEFPAALNFDGLTVNWSGQTRPREDMRWFPHQGRPAPHHLGYNAAERRVQQIVFEYDVKAHIRHSGRTPLVSFKFSNRSFRDHHDEPPPIEERQRTARELKLVRDRITVLDKHRSRLGSWERLQELWAAQLRDLQEEDLWQLPGELGIASWYVGNVKKVYDALLEKRSRLRNRGYSYRLLHSPKAKLEEWAYKACDWELLAKLRWPKATDSERQKLIKVVREPGSRTPCLGPIVLWGRTDAREVALKMAFLAARLGLLQSAEPVVDALAAFLKVDESDARDVFGHATLSGKKRLGYVEDYSHVGFKAYLRNVAVSIWKQDHDVSLSSTRGSDSDAGEGHPWNLGKPALLGRLASEFGVNLHIARQWVRDGKLGANDCKRRGEQTKTGEVVKGDIEIPASERPVWEDLCARHYDMRSRKLQTCGKAVAEKKRAVAEKKRWYREARRPGEGRDRAAVGVQELASCCGLARRGQ